MFYACSNRNYSHCCTIDLKSLALFGAMCGAYLALPMFESTMAQANGLCWYWELRLRLIRAACAWSKQFSPFPKNAQPSP